MTQDTVSEIVEAARAFKVAIRESQSNSALLMATRWQMLLRETREELAKLSEKYAKQIASGKPLTPSQIFREKRWLYLEAQLSLLLSEFFDFCEASIEQEQVVWARWGATQAITMLRLMDAPLSSNFTGIPVDAVEAIVGTTQSGTPLDSVLKRAAGNNVAEVRDTLTKAVTFGINPRTAGRLMAKAVDGGLTRAILIARSEQMRALNYGSLERYRESNLVRGWTRICTLDSRTCIACAALNNTYYSVQTEVQLHPACRCTALPVLKGEKKLPRNVDFEAWIRSKPVEEQKSFFGPSRYKLWKEGKPLSAFGELKSDKVWGDQPVIIPLKRLQK